MALVLAEAVDARVYVPLVESVTERVRRTSVPVWDEAAACAVTDMVAPRRPVDDSTHVGRHRA